MKGADKEARRWFRQAEDDFHFVDCVLETGRFLIRVASSLNRQVRNPSTHAFTPAARGAF